MLPKERVERDEEDLVRLYLTDIGQYPLLTKDDEVRLAQAIEGGDAARAELAQGEDAHAGQASSELRRGSARANEAQRTFVQSNLRLVVSIAKKYQASGLPAARPDPGGQPRPDARRREVRLAQGLQVLHLRHLVDPPGHHPWHRQHGPHHPSAGARGRHPGPAPEGAPAWSSSSAARPRCPSSPPSGDARGQADRSAALPRRAALAVRAAA